MTESQRDHEQQWRRSSVGITPLTVRPRVGTRLIKTQDVVGTEIKTKGQHPQAVRGVGAGAAGGGIELGTEGVGRVCSVCARASADYSCPRCLIGYCSSNCYKTHGSGCTEAFFRGHVERETRLREEEEASPPFGQGSGRDGSGGGAKEQRRASMIEVLRRCRHNDNKGDDEVVAGGGGGDDSSSEGLRRGNGDDDDDADGGLALQDRRLKALALALESHGRALAAPRGSNGGGVDGLDSALGRKNDDNADDDGGEGHGGGRRRRRTEEEGEGGGHGVVGGSCVDEAGALLGLLTEDERALFLREVASGRLSKLIVPWVPWWKQSGGVQEILTATTVPSAAADSKLSHNSCCGRPSDGPPSLASTNSSTNGTISSNVSSCPSTQPPTPEQTQSNYASDGGLASTATVHPAAPAMPLVRPPPWGTAAGEAGGVASTDEEDCARHSFAALLTRAPESPDFSTLCARPPSPTLPALAADLSYAYVVTMRLYNGCWCVDPVGASLAFVGASPVLKDAAKPSGVAEALSACVERAVDGEGVPFSGYAESLLQDVLALCSDARKLTCAFQDAWGMLEAACRTLAPSNPNLKAPLSSKPLKKKSQRRAAKELGKVGKRVGYFLLWARSHGSEAAPEMSAAVLRVVDARVGYGKDGTREEGLPVMATGGRGGRGVEAVGRVLVEEV